MSRDDQVRVCCPRCAWRGYRIYASVDGAELTSGRETTGFGTCPRCQTPVVRQASRCDRRAERERQRIARGW